LKPPRASGKMPESLQHPVSESQSERSMSW
jgi:hypothetical protein